MTRLEAIDPAKDTGPGADLLNGPLKDKQLNIFKGMAVNAAVLQAFLGFAGGVKNAGSLTPADHEVIALTTAQMRDCDYCLAAHSELAKGVGINEELALDIRKGEGRDDREQALIDFTRAILEAEGFVRDEQLEAFRAAGFDDAAVIEVIGGIAVNTMTNLYNHVNGTEIDFPVPAAV